MKFPGRGEMTLNNVALLKHVAKMFYAIFGCSGFRWCTMCPFREMLYCPGRAMQDLLKQIDEDLEAEAEFWKHPEKHEESYREFVERRQSE